MAKKEPRKNYPLRGKVLHGVLKKEALKVIKKTPRKKGESSSDWLDRQVEAATPPASAARDKIEKQWDKNLGKVEAKRKQYDKNLDKVNRATGDKLKYKKY